MGVRYSPAIVTSGLVLSLDAANRKSYIGSGNVWNDLSGNNYTSSLVGSPSWDGRKFTFPDSQITVYGILPRTALNNLTSGTTYTLEIITSFDNTDDEYFFSMATTSIDNHFIMQKNTIILPVSSTILSGTSPSVSAGETMSLSIINNGGTITLYKNGISSATYNGGSCSSDLKLTEGWLLNQEQDCVLGCFDSTQNCAMKTSIIRLYNRTLTASEVLQNHTANKNRFGL